MSKKKPHFQPQPPQTSKQPVVENSAPHASAPGKATDLNDLLPMSLTEKVGTKDPLDAIFGHYTAWLPRYQEFAQGRSNFQIEKMIATEHATPAASYQHTLYQLRVMHQSLISDFVRGIEQKRTFEYKWNKADKEQPQWWEQGKEGKKLCWYDTDRLQHEHELEELKMSVKDKLLQLQTFTKVLEAMEEKHAGPYTSDDLNNEEPEYWKLRLARQMSDEYLDRQTGLGTGSLKSLRMAMAESPISGSKNKVENFPDLINSVLAGRETGLEALNAVNEELFGYMNNLTNHQATIPKPSSEPAVTRAASVNVTEAEQLAHLKNAGIGISGLKD